MEVETEGFLLFFTPYQEDAEIATFFTPLGLISLIRKKWKGKRADPLALYATYLLQIYEKREGLSRLQEATLINPHLFLREDIAFMETAAEMADCLRKSQLPQEPAEALYSLFLRFIRRIPKSKDLTTHVAAFCLKLLLHEGVPFPELKSLGWQDGIGPLTFQEMEAHPFSQDEKNAILRHLEKSL